jgi:hypothetical protein
VIFDMNRAEGSIRMDGMAFEMDLKWKYPDLVFLRWHLMMLRCNLDIIST